LTPSTQELVKAAQAGDRTAFAHLVQLYERATIVTAFAELRDFHAAQDAAQEAFVIAYAKLNQLRRGSAFGPWILQIVRRQALQMQRSPQSEEIGSEIVAVGKSNDWIAEYSEVIEQLARLPEQERTVVVLRYMDGHSVQAIADTIGKPVGTVTKQLSRAVRRLRTWLTEVPS
jgi:RNA polymerase sigma-70 factor (ECF subfamily)